jgi:hypothetical protein
MLARIGIMQALNPSRAHPPEPRQKRAKNSELRNEETPQPRSQLLIVLTKRCMLRGLHLPEKKLTMKLILSAVTPVALAILALSIPAPIISSEASATKMNGKIPSLELTGSRWGAEPAAA